MGYQFALARYIENGDLDKHFDDDGKVLTNFRSARHEYGYSLAVDSRGRIILGGFADVGGSMRFALARYNVDGSLDKSFDNDGKVLTDFTSSKYEYGYDLAVDSRDRIVLCGYAEAGGSVQFALARYNVDGSLDKSFDYDGKVLTDIAFAQNEWAHAVAVDSKDRIILGGGASVGTSDKFALARYETDGSVDKRFGANRNGIVVTDFTRSKDEWINSIAIDSDDRIIVGGCALIDKNVWFALACYKPDGSLDKGFGGNKNGKVVTDFYADEWAWANAVGIDGKDRIILGGSAEIAGFKHFALARYKSDGYLDTSFGKDNTGKVVTDFKSGKRELIAAIAVDHLGRIVVGGTAEVGRSYQFALARYTENGRLDNSFHGDGKVLTDFFSSEDEKINGLAIDRNGCIVAGGIALVRQCHLRLILEKVVYGGNDVGNDWEYGFYLRGKYIKIPEHILDHGKTEKPNAEIYNQEVESVLGKVGLRMQVVATEKDWFFDDFGITGIQRTFACPSSNSFVVNVKVMENLWGTASLDFYFRAELTLKA